MAVYCYLVLTHFHEINLATLPKSPALRYIKQAGGALGPPKKVKTCRMN
jgi:hypothetical protein